MAALSVPDNQAWSSAVERVCLAVFLVWLAALPLPFGSVIERARAPLIVVPLAVCLAASLLRLYVVRDRGGASAPTRPWLIWAGGGALVMLAGALQLVPLPPSLLRLVSPESYAIWSDASRVATLAGVRASAAHPVSIDPAATAFELLRIGALLATFTASALLVRTQQRRVWLAGVLCLAALFEALYGVREAALQRYQIWGWVNRLIFNRVTGTFVNPNHFAHYVAITLPMAFFLAAVAWHRAGPSRIPLRQRLVVLIERQILWIAAALLCIVFGMLAILLAQSRGALVAVGAGVLMLAAIRPGKRLTRIALGAIAGLLLVAALAVLVGTKRTSLGRFAASASEQQSLGGRRIGIEAAMRLWLRFPILGSGHGTFERAVFMEQREDLGKTYHHAHNDYAELAATAGTVGGILAIATLIAGFAALSRMTFSTEARQELSRIRRAFQAAALTSLAIAMIHALFDFNFFIPSNPATLAAIVGAAVAATDYDKRTRR